MAQQTQETRQACPSKHIPTYLTSAENPSQTEANQIHIAAGATSSPKQRKYQNIGNRLALLKDRFLHQQMTVQDSADQASFCIQVKIPQ